MYGQARMRMHTQTRPGAVGVASVEVAAARDAGKESVGLAKKAASALVAAGGSPNPSTRTVIEGAPLAGAERQARKQALQDGGLLLGGGAVNGDLVAVHPVLHRHHFLHRVRGRECHKANAPVALRGSRGAALEVSVAAQTHSRMESHCAPRLHFVHCLASSWAV